MVTRMGFEPMNATLRGWCVEPLHQRVIKNRLMSILYYYFSFVKNTNAKTAIIAIADTTTIGIIVPLLTFLSIEIPFCTALTTS